MPKHYKGMRARKKTKVARFPGGLRATKKTTGMKGRRAGRLVTIQQPLL